MRFQVKEVKLLGAENEWASLSLRMEAPDPVVSRIKYTVHAVLPYIGAGTKPPTVGDEFELLPVEK